MLPASCSSAMIVTVKHMLAVCGLNSKLAGLQANVAAKLDPAFIFSMMIVSVCLQVLRLLLRSS